MKDPQEIRAWLNDLIGPPTLEMLLTAFLIFVAVDIFILATYLWRSKFDINIESKESAVTLDEKEKIVYNEQTKLLATALNTAATSCFTVGIATPIAGYIYNVSNIQNTLDWQLLGVGAFGWLVAAVTLHLLGRRALRGLEP